jgi:hypothetical protein
MSLLFLAVGLFLAIFNTLSIFSIMLMKSNQSTMYLL